MKKKNIMPGVAQKASLYDSWITKKDKEKKTCPLK
jgi:hypothetical protein